MKAVTSEDFGSRHRRASVWSLPLARDVLAFSVANSILYGSDSTVLDEFSQMCADGKLKKEELGHLG